MKYLANENMEPNLLLYLSFIMSDITKYNHKYLGILEYYKYQFMVLKQYKKDGYDFFIGETHCGLPKYHPFIIISVFI